MVKTRRYVKACQHEGMVKTSDFRIVEEDMDENLKEGEVLTDAVCISVDPYQRLLGTPIGETISGFQVAKVLKSKNPKYPQGCLVMQLTGWQTVCKSNDESIWYKVDEKYKNVKPASFLGSAGMPGLTAYFCINDICKPESGQTIFINGSAGAVGTVAGQLAKLKGCRVIGAAGSDAKIEYIKSIGYDDAFNYKKEKTADALEKMAPKNIDCFLDNIGGQMTIDVMHKMNPKGRIAICGSISAYNDQSAKVGVFHFPVITKQLLIQGIYIFTMKDRIQEAVDTLLPLIEQGKLKTKETITQGFENVSKAFVGLFHGENTGKAVVNI